MVRPIKMLLASSTARRMACAVAALYIRLVYFTGRWQVVGAENPRALWDEGKPFIASFWHGRIMMMPYVWRRDKVMNMLISQHRDGALIADTIAHFDFGTVRGSTSKDGARALRSMVKALKRGEYVGITPDGPRGPRMHASEGIAIVARLSGVPVLPVAFSASRRRVLGSWDRFLVALPFSRGVFVWGKPVEVPRGADQDDLAEALAAIEKSLNEATAEADKLCGLDPVQPADLT